MKSCKNCDAWTEINCRGRKGCSDVGFVGYDCWCPVDSLLIRDEKEEK